MSRKAFFFFSLIIFAIYTVFAILLNSQGLDGFVGLTNSFSAFDEIYSIREVYNILESKSLKEWVLNIIAGNGYVYGRFIYACNALLCFIPYSIFGLKGLVFTMRMAHCLYLFFGFYLIVKYLNKDYTNRILSLMVLVVLPVTLYFMGIPKPEPMQILLLGLFFNLKTKYNWAWLFLGLAFGTKISVAFSVLFIAGIEMYYSLKAKNIKSIWLKGCYALLGVIIALPGLIFATFNPYFKNGLVNIVSTTSKPYDDKSISFLDWTHKFFSYFYELPAWFSYILMLLLMLSAFYLLLKDKDKRDYIIFALLAIIPIMLLTKRLWGHYLFLGVAMLIPLVFDFIHQIAKKRIVVWVIFALFMIQIIPHFSSTYKASTRDSEESFLETKGNTEHLVSYMQKKTKAKIGVDLTLYFDYSWIANSQIEIASKDEYQDLDILIIPAKHQYKLSSNYSLIESVNGLSVFKK